jgi:sugar phosphate permease
VGKLFYGWWIVIACFCISFYISGAVVFSFTAFFEPIAGEFGWSYTQISIAASIRGLELGLFAPLMGFLVDRFGPRRLLLCGTFTIGIGCILISLTHSLAMFYGAFVVLALGLSGCVGTVMPSAAANWFQMNVGKALGIISAGVGAGGLLVPVVISLIDRYQWRTTFVIIGLGMWLIGIPLACVIRRRPEEYGYLPDGKESKTQSIPAKDLDREINYKEALKNRVFWHLSIAEAIRLMTLSALITHVMPYLSNLNISRSHAALVATLIPVLSIFGRLFFGWLGDVFNKYHVMTLVYFLAGMSLLAFAYAHITGFIVCFLILFPLSWGAQPLRGAIIREYFGRLSFGTIVGILSGIGTLARIVGPALAGWSFDTFGRYYFIWLFYAGTFTIAIILMLTIKSDQKATETVPN